MRIKYLLIGLVAGVLLATTGTSFAADAIKKVTASIRTDYIVELDGKTLPLLNDPLAYDGKSYLPVRELSEILGKNVDFNNNTIILTTKESYSFVPVPAGWISLNELEETRGLKRIYRLPEGVHPSKQIRELVITIEDKELIFEIPGAIYDNLVTVINEDGVELRYINGEAYLHESVIPASP
jgi:hypothetical protein